MEGVKLVISNAHSGLKAAIQQVFVQTDEKSVRVKIHSTNTLERLNKEVKQRVDVVGIFPNEESIMRLLGAVLTEQNEEWLLQNRYLPQHTMAEIDYTAEDDVIDALPLSV